MDEVLKEIHELKQLIVEQNILKKEVLNFTEAAQYLEVSSSHLYKLTSSGIIPAYKPNGKKLYFNRKELDEWLLSNKQTSEDEIEQQASKDRTSFYWELILKLILKVIDWLFSKLQ